MVIIRSHQSSIGNYKVPVSGLLYSSCIWLEVRPLNDLRVVENQVWGCDRHMNNDGRPFGGQLGPAPTLSGECPKDK